jgi:hypothetical protein
MTAVVRRLSFIYQERLAAFGRHSCTSLTSHAPPKVADTDLIVERSATSRTEIFRLASNSPPIRNKQALFNDTPDRARRKVDCSLAYDDGEREYREANGHRSSANAKELVKIKRNDSGAIVKI